MNSQDLSNLQEAYLEVYQLDELNKRTLQSYQSKAKNEVLGSMSRVSDTTVKRVKGLQQAQKRLRDKKYGQQKEQVDLYDIILSHLLDEGYVETQEQAEVIMVNMSEDWRESIVEGYKSFPHGKVEAKAKRLEADSRTNEPLAGKSDSEVDSILARKKKSGERANSLNLASRTSHSFLPKQKEKSNRNRPESEKRSKTVEPQKSFGNRLTRSDRQGIQDSYDLYGIILSHLLDEGYAETQEQAEVIMVNMSEDWRESIVEEILEEGEKPFPYEKVTAQQKKHNAASNYGNTMKMGLAKRRAKEADKKGGSQQDAGKDWYHGK